MEKLFIAIMLLLVCEAVMKSCNQQDRGEDTIVHSPVQRIELEYDDILAGRKFIVLRVDGHTYLTSTAGGFIHLSTCEACYMSWGDYRYQGSPDTLVADTLFTL